LDTEAYREAIEYEALTKKTYEAILGNIDVRHNVKVRGRSGVEHQIDVFWEFRQAGVTHRVLIECKNHASNLTMEKARNFHSVVQDIGNCIGIMVTKTGYQSGAADYCRAYGLQMKVLRSPTEEDWDGRLRELTFRQHVRAPLSDDEHGIECTMFLRSNSDEQHARLEAAAALDPNLAAATSSTRFLGPDGEPCEEELKWWLPRQIPISGKEDGGPYVQPVELPNHYLHVDCGIGAELVQVIGVRITYHVGTLDVYETVISAENLVAEILKDFDTGVWEHINRPPGSHGDPDL
jgi:hypothetical protein